VRSLSILADSFAKGLESVVLELRRRSARLRKFGMALAILLFAAGFFLAIRHVPQGVRLNVRIIAAYALLFPPVGYVLQSAEMWLSAKATGVTLRHRQAIEIIVYANAFALLPIPGGLLTRTAALRAHGVSVARSISAVILFTSIAGSISFAYAGLWNLSREPVLGAAALLIAAGGGGVSCILSQRLQVSREILRNAVIVAVLAVLYETGTFIVIFAAIGTSITAEQAAFLVVSGFIAMALTIFPSGFGVREAIVALISPLVGIDPATAFLAAAAARVVGLIWMVAIAIAILATGPRRISESGR
jgi:hypothetical protein